MLVEGAYVQLAWETLVTLNTIKTGSGVLLFKFIHLSFTRLFYAFVKTQVVRRISV